MKDSDRHHLRGRMRRVTKKRRNAQQTGMEGVYRVAAELTSRGFIVSPTSRSAKGADLLVTNSKCSQAFTVQVKANWLAPAYWLTGPNAISYRSHIVVLVNLLEEGGSGEPRPPFYVVPGRIAKRLTRSRRAKTGKRIVFYSIYRSEVAAFRDGWRIFGNPG